MHNLKFCEPVLFCCRRRAISNSLYELNEAKTTVRPTVGDTYNEIENEPVSFKDLTEYTKPLIFIIYLMSDKVKYFSD